MPYGKGQKIASLTRSKNSSHTRVEAARAGEMPSPVHAEQSSVASRTPAGGDGPASPQLQKYLK